MNAGVTDEEPGLFRLSLAHGNMAQHHVPSMGIYDLPFPMRMGILGSTAAGKRHQAELAFFPGTALYPVPRCLVSPPLFLIIQRHPAPSDNIPKLSGYLTG